VQDVSLLAGYPAIRKILGYCRAVLSGNREGQAV
jgi:hypothetical protein